MKIIYAIVLFVSLSFIANSVRAQSAQSAALQADLKKKIEMRKQEIEKIRQKTEDQKKQQQSEKLNQPISNSSQQANSATPANPKKSEMQQQVPDPKQPLSRQLSIPNKPNKKEDINQ